MKIIRLSLIVLILSTCILQAQVPQLEWAKGLSGTSSTIGTSVKVDDLGNVYTTGYFIGTTDFDPGAGITNLTSAVSYDIFVSKLDKDGNFVWAFRIGASGADNANGIAIDGSGNLYITGRFNGTVDFDPGVGTANLTSSAGIGDIFILKLNAAGAFQWAVKIGSTGADEAQDITVDPAGDILITGQFSGSVDFDPGAGVTTLVSQGGLDIFISKFSNAGNFIWAKSIGSTSSDVGNSITTDISGNVLTTGYFNLTVDFDPGPGTANLTSAFKGAFISKLNSNGDFVLAKTFTSTSSVEGASIAVDISGNIFTTGDYTGTVDFDPGVGVFNQTEAGSGDIFISKLDASGNFLWAAGIGDFQEDGGFSIAVDVSGNCYFTGHFAATVDFDPGPGIFNLSSTPANSYDIFISKFDPAGNLVFAVKMGGPDDFEIGQSISIDGSGNIFTTGQFSGVADFDPGPGTFNLTGVGSENAFVMKLNPPVPTISNFTPSSGPIGTSVTITGTNFSSTATDNQVEFNGTVATVISSSATTITTTVPLGATTGLITVTVAGNTAISLSNFTVTVASCVSVGERNALIALFNSTDGANWTDNSGWLSADESTWFGVSISGCDVTGLSLPNNNLTGSLPTEIGVLTQLTSLNIFNNNISGTLPTTISNLTNAITLELGSNQLTGFIPPLIANLSSLERLDMSYNQFTGSIPTGIGTMTSLKQLFFHVNQLSGVLPASIGNLVNLTSFSVFNNQLSGTVPGSLANLINLTSLVLSVNQFTGDLPSGIGLIPNLANVSVRDNDFTSIPTFVSASFTDLWVYGNKLHFGHLEPNFGIAGFVYSPQDNLPGGSTSACEGGTLNINFSTPGTNNAYQWFKDGIIIPGATSSNFAKANVSSSDAGNYTVQVTNSIVTGLTLQSDNFVVTINPLPSKPIIVSSITPTGSNVSVCSSNLLTLTAPAGFSSYAWSNGETTQQITITTSSIYTVIVTKANGCSSPSSDAITTTVIPAPCSNQSPVINTIISSTPIAGKVSIDLILLISDVDNNLDLATLKIINQPTSGAPAQIINSILTIDYAGISFSGQDKITIEVCDLLGSCTQQELTIEVGGDLIIYSGISPNGDTYNEKWIIQNIESLPDTKENKVSIYNRWGDLIFETTNYDNDTQVFKGINKNGNEVTSGVYFYRIEFASNKRDLTGYLTIKK